MNSDFISVKDFAEAAGVSQQSIYKRLAKDEDDLQPFVKIIEKKKYLNIAALRAVYSIEYRPKEEDDKAEAAANPLYELLKMQLEGQRKDIDEKDRQILQLMEQLATAQRLIDQQQQLAVLDKKRILELEASLNGEAEEETTTEEAAKSSAAAATDQKQTEQKEIEKPAAKKGFFNIFRKLK